MNSSIEDGECSPEKLAPALLAGLMPSLKLCGELEESIDYNDEEEEEEEEVEQEETLKNEINDILEDKDLKNKLLEMIVHKWPILDTGSHENFIELVEKNISPALSEELSKLDTFNSLQQNMTEHMLEIFRYLYKDEAQDNYSASNKFEYEVAIERSKKDYTNGR